MPRLPLLATAERLLPVGQRLAMGCPVQSRWNCFSPEGNPLHFRSISRFRILESSIRVKHPLPAIQGLSTG